MSDTGKTDEHVATPRSARRVTLRHGKILALGLAAALLSWPATAQVAPPGSPLEGWDLSAPPAAPATGVTVVPRTGDKQPGAGGQPVQLIGLLTEDGQRIDKGLVWRIYEETNEPDKRGKLVRTERVATPLLSLKPGQYIINAAFGRAHLTRKITIPEIEAGEPKVEKFVLNAGGLRVTALIGKDPAPDGSVSYSILTDRDQADERRVVLQGIKPAGVVRLNAGIYHIVSTYGDANAIVRSDVTVEAGKLTEAQIQHTFAKVSFKLVERSGGEALPATNWTVQTPDGAIVKESVGALPSHTLAPGTYTVVARNQQRAFRRDFKVEQGETAEIEVVITQF